MNLAILLFQFVPQIPPPEIVIHEVEGELQVDAVVAAVDPLEFLSRLAREAGRELQGTDALIGRPRLDVNLSGRSLESVLDLVGFATRTRIALGRRTITVAPERTLAEVEECRQDAEAAWVSLIREFPAHEAARTARVELGGLQERTGHEDAALMHYDAAVRDGQDSPAAQRALRAAGGLLMRRGEWSEAMRRFSRLAQTSQDEETQVEARISISRALAEQGRGAEALALVDVIDLSYPPRDEKAVAARRLARARAHLASGSAADALRELDRRAASDPRLSATPEDLALRARALEELQAPLEAARAWLACSSVAGPSDRDEALLAAARLSAAGGDDIAVLFVERLARGGARATDVARLADAARTRLGIGADVRDLDQLQRRWDARARLAPRDLAALAAELVAAVARERGADEAALVARTALAEVPDAEARAIRSALAVAYEKEGAWAEAARTWGGSAP